MEFRRNSIKVGFNAIKNGGMYVLTLIEGSLQANPGMVWNFFLFSLKFEIIYQSF